MSDFNIKFNHNSGIPLYRQLYEYLLKEIHNGNLKENEKLPSRRMLCNRLNVNKNTVEAAYQKLTAEGYIMSEPRSGFYVKTKLDNFDKDEDTLPDYTYNFSINGIDVMKIPNNIWGKLYKDTILENPNLFNHGENFGERILQKAIQKYLYDTRGINCYSNQIIIGAGMDYLILMTSLVMNKNTIYGIENPCMKRIYSTLNICDKKIRLINVTKDGFSTELLKNSNINVLFVMPSHQYPVGYKISLEQRHELINWANSGKNRYIIEFHYDSDFIYDKSISPIYSLDTNEKVIYIGDFVKTIGPSIKTSFVILPNPLLKKWKQRLNTYYSPVNLFEQWVLAEFIQKGFFTRHIKQMKDIYMKKKDYLISELKNCSFYNKMEIYNANGGTHFIAKFNTDIPEKQMERAARLQKVKIVPLSRNFITSSPLSDEKYFVFGFGGFENFEIREAVSLLEKAWGTL